MLETASRRLRHDQGGHSGLLDRDGLLRKLSDSVISHVNNFNEDQVDNGSIIEVLTELTDFCELTGSTITIDAMRCALNGRSITGCLLDIQRTGV